MHRVWQQEIARPGLENVAKKTDHKVAVCTTGRGVDNTAKEVCVRKALDFTPFGSKHVCYPVDDKKHPKTQGHPAGCPSDMRRAKPE